VINWFFPLDTALGKAVILPKQNWGCKSRVFMVKQERKFEAEMLERE
jgi:hypothetical protein